MSAITAGWLYVGWGAPLFETYYGLMQHSPSEIKERLLKALDKEYNVVDMAAVLEIVSILERTPITKEALETTRLGRDINELRRKTKNESLAKRAKELVKRWRDLILKQTEAENNQQNGGRTAGKRPISPATSVANSDDRSSPGLPEAVPRTHASNKRLRKTNTETPLINGGSPESSEPVVTPSPSNNRDIVKEKIARIARVPKVKTTQELVAGLRGDKPVAASADLAKNKTEHIARFLRSEPEDEDVHVDVEEVTPTPAGASHPRFTPPDDILARLPPLDPSTIVWSDSEPPTPPPPLCPDSFNERQIDGINGNLADSSDPSSFVEFHQVLTRTLTNGDIIHILPYVIID